MFSKMIRQYYTELLCFVFMLAGLGFCFNCLMDSKNGEYVSAGVALFTGLLFFCQAIMTAAKGD